MMLGFVAWAAAIAVVVALIAYLYVLRRVLGVRILRPHVDEAGGAQPDPLFTEDFSRADGLLQSLGFESRYWMRFDNPPDQGPQLVRVYHHREEPAVARVYAPFSSLHINGPWIEFGSRLREGRELSTVNGWSHLLDGDSPLLVIQDSQGVSLEAQWRLHRKAIRQHAAEIEPLATPGEEVRHLNGLLEQQFDHLRSRNRIWRTEEGVWRYRLGAALPLAVKILRGTLRSGKPAISAPTVPLSPQREAWFFRRWREEKRRTVPPASVQLRLLLFTSLLFVVLGGLVWDWAFTLMVGLVIAVHELGHYLTMRAFGYRDLQMVLIPLMGGVTTGAERNGHPLKRVLVSLMGPLPGIFIGIALLFATGGTSDSPLFELGLIFLLINALNLLPVLPLDGGWIVREAIPERWWPAIVLVNLFSILVLLVAAAYLLEPLFLLLALVPLGGALGAYRQHRILERARRELPDGADEQTAVMAVLNAIHAQTPKPEGAAAKRFSNVETLLRQLRHPPKSAVMATGLLGIYLAAWMLPFALFAYTPAGETVLTYTRSWLQTWRGDPVDYEEVRREIAGLSVPQLLQRWREERGDVQEDGTGVPGGEAEVVAAEARLGRPLPLSYRHFLLSEDGWKLGEGAGALWPATHLQKVDVPGTLERDPVWRQTKREITELDIVSPADPAARNQRLPVDALEKMIMVGDTRDGGLYLLDSDNIFYVRLAEGWGERYPDVKGLLVNRYLQERITSHWARFQ